MLDTSSTCRLDDRGFQSPLWVYIALMQILCLSSGNAAFGQTRVLDGAMHHLRVGDEPEWASFPVHADDRQLTVRFEVSPGEKGEQQTLRIRQQDVKQAWQVHLNGERIGALIRDEKDTVIYLPVPAGSIKAGENTLRIEQKGTVPDDIRVGEIRLVPRPPDQVLSEAALGVEVIDKTGTHIPARITVVNADGALQSVGAHSNGHLAVRPGFVYTGNGKALFGLAAGRYTVYAGRGFEYGIDSVQLRVRPGEEVRRTLEVRREVPTEGWVSSDTHIHTYTYSHHGDATARERALTIAGEGIELPIITDHNVHVDLGPVAETAGVRSYFTPVIGNEVTTPVGHFNVFPVAEETTPPKHQVESWQAVSRSIRRVPEARVIVLNHARDVHSGFRPFGPKHHIGVAGVNLDGWTQPANAMEVINSGAQQTDMMQLYRDWFGMLNRGYDLTPVGSSDSHDVSRYLVGQARTYIRSQAEDPASIDVREAITNLQKGSVSVSFGLLATVTVNEEYGPGDLVPASDEMTVSVQVLGPGWVQADRVALYVNGQKAREAAVADSGRAGVKWSGTWTLPRPKHDVFLAAIAQGPGVQAPYWSVAKPYQPTSPRWTPKVIGSTGAVWIDADGDGHRTSAHAYARQLVASTDGELRPLIRKLAPYGEAVAVQVAALLHEQGRSLTAPDVSAALQDAAPATKSGFHRFIEAWKASQNVRRSR